MGDHAGRLDAELFAFLLTRRCRRAMFYRKKARFDSTKVVYSLSCTRNGGIGFAWGCGGGGAGVSVSKLLLLLGDDASLSLA